MSARATGVGSVPGTDLAESLKVVLGTLPDLPHLPEQPARGAAAALVGRSLGTITDAMGATPPEPGPLRRAPCSRMSRPPSAGRRISASGPSPRRIGSAAPERTAAAITWSRPAGTSPPGRAGSRPGLPQASAMAAPASHCAITGPNSTSSPRCSVSTGRSLRGGMAMRRKVCRSCARLCRPARSVRSMP